MQLRNKILKGDCYELLKTLPAASIDCVITSPPYFRVRDYFAPKTHWPECRLEVIEGFGAIIIPAMECCLGLEENYLHFIAHLVLIFEEIRRVLKPWGTAWINMGDTYAGNGAAYGNPEQSTLIGRPQGTENGMATRAKKAAPGIKKKDLFGIPWLLAFALRQAGWYLRSDIIWNKENPQPESVTDRPVKAHEYIFLLSKQKHYYYDHHAIRTPIKEESLKRQLRAIGNNHKHLQGAPGQPPHTIKRPVPNLNNKATGMEALDAGRAIDAAGANKRSVWTVNTRGFKGSHFAVYPKELIKDMVLAGTSEHGNCAECGKPWSRIVEKTIVPTKKAGNKVVVDDRDRNADDNDQGSNRALDGHKPGHVSMVITRGWEKGCKCATEEVVRPIVLDPFGGRGTTGVVARNLSRDWLLMEIGEHYVKIANKWMKEELGMFH